MSWTDKETVMAHLLALERKPTTVTDEAAKVSAEGKATLNHKGLVNGSETVKIELQLEPCYQANVALNDETWTSLSHAELMPGEVVVATDSGLETVYQTDKDYCFDAKTGKLRRIAGGGIGNGEAVQVYYRRYQPLVKDIDYSIDYAAGSLTRIPGGAMKLDTTVFVDYELTAAASVEALAEEAVTEAEDKIVRRLKSDYTAESTDQGLVTGATELTLAILCRSLAAQALADGLTSAEGRSRGWRELADKYETAAWITLRPFLTQPALAGSVKKANSNWEWQ